MPGHRIYGRNIPEQAQVWSGLRVIYGIGKTRALTICKEANIERDKYVRDLTEEETNQLRKTIEKLGYILEGDLRREVSMNIKRLMDIGCYRGIRHRRGLPLRGQRTRTNAKTRRKKR